MMKKSVNQVLFAGLIVLMMVGMSFAGTSTVNHGAATNPFAIAVETLGSARNVVVVGLQAAGQNMAAANMPISYTLTQDMTTQNLLQVTLTNAAFNGNTVYMCAPSAANAANTVRIGTGTPAANVTTFNFQSAANVASGSYVFLTDYACPVAETLVVAGAQNMSLRVPSGVSVGNGTIEMRTVTAGNIPVDPTSTATAVNIAREFTTTLTTRNMVIDYLNANADGTSDGTKFDQGASSNVTVTRGGIAGAANTFVIAKSATINYTTVAGAGLVTGFTVGTAADTVWTGAVNTYLADAAICAAANIMGTAVTTPTGAVNLTHAYGGLLAANYDLCINVDGTTELLPRTITGTHQVTVTGVGANPLAAASGSFQVWTTNGFQAFVPHMRWSTDGQTRTFVRFVNRAARTAVAQVAIQRSGIATPVVADLASIPANGIVTYNAQTIATDNGITDDNYAALFTIKTARNNIYGEAFFNLAGYGTRGAALYENPINKDFQLK